MDGKKSQCHIVALNRGGPLLLRLRFEPPLPESIPALARNWWLNEISVMEGFGGFILGSNGAGHGRRQRRVNAKSDQNHGRK